MPNKKLNPEQIGQYSKEDKMEFIADTFLKYAMIQRARLYDTMINLSDMIRDQDLNDLCAAIHFLESWDEKEQITDTILNEIAAMIGIDGTQRVTKGYWKQLSDEISNEQKPQMP